MRELEFPPLPDLIKRTRPSWDEYFLDLAKMAATRSTCERLNVGCVLVQRNRVVATGYNGSPRGTDHCLDEGCVLDGQGRCVRTIHAEQNALLFASGPLLGSTCYTTHEPCETCTKLLVQIGVARVVFTKPYSSAQFNLYNGNLRWEMMT